MILSALLATSSATLALPAAEPAKIVTLPVTISYNLEKNKVTLPADLAGASNLLILSYSPSQQKDAESWLPAAKSLAAARTDFHFYVLPVFARQNILYRLWMNSSMRSDSPTSESWPWTIPLYVNKEHFEQELDIHSESEITLLLVDKAGKVFWRNAGGLTDEKKAALLAGLGPTPVKGSGTH